VTNGEISYSGIQERVRNLWLKRKKAKWLLEERKMKLFLIQE